VVEPDVTQLECEKCNFSRWSPVEVGKGALRVGAVVASLRCATGVHKTPF